MRETEHKSPQKGVSKIVAIGNLCMCAKRLSASETWKIIIESKLVECS